LGWAYALTLGTALLYLGEHYVVDLLAGLALAEGVRLGTPLLTPLARRISSLAQALEAQARS
jgi:membrane-associated phospholipid phosphatase